jgi:hypothetical protein
MAGDLGSNPSVSTVTIAQRDRALACEAEGAGAVPAGHPITCPFRPMEGPLVYIQQTGVRIPQRVLFGGGKLVCQRGSEPRVTRVRFLPSELLRGS